MHKINEIEKYRKAKLKLLNKLGEGYIHVDEGSDPEEILLDDAEKEANIKEHKEIDEKASFYRSSIKKSKMKNSKKNDDYPKDDFSPGTFIEEKPAVKAHDDKKKDNINISESNSIFDVIHGKNISENEFGRENKKIKNNERKDFYLNTSIENIIIEKTTSDLGFGNNEAGDYLNDRKQETQSKKNPKEKRDK